MSQDLPASRLQRFISWLSLAAELVLPLLFLHAWLAPDLQSDDRLLSLVLVLAGENVVLYFMLFLSPVGQWGFREWLAMLGFGGLIALVASAASNGGYSEASGAALLVLWRFAALAFGRRPASDDFPATPLQALTALGIFWALLLAVGLLADYGLQLGSEGSAGPLATHGTLYFSALLGIRIARMARAGRARSEPAA